MENPNESNVRALRTAVNLAREAIAEREASDNPDDHELLDGYRADVERAEAALDRMAAPETVALAAGPVSVRRFSRESYRVRDHGEGEDTRAPSNRAARRKRERDARKAAKVSNASKHTGKP